ncbi:hypothetical protein L195_g036985 [Trifolium pratense]|uniref:Uncharacterized protein n=1 Tax=Trifolium pratense TaxID=57577 RepID=A0A2K3LR14_TRIPR|nr:hypothetical protein L195_g036985 [Trifolium pratense]
MERGLPDVVRTVAVELFVAVAVIVMTDAGSVAAGVGAVVVAGVT